MSGATAQIPVADAAPGGEAREYEIPLVEWATIALRASRIAPSLPHMAWYQIFDEHIPREALVDEAKRFASCSYGVGRRVVKSRIPTGRGRWVPSRAYAPPIMAPEPVEEGDELAAWIDRHMAVRLDPGFGAGWQIAAAHTTSGRTFVLYVVHHLFGIARGLMGAMYAAGEEDPTFGTTGLRFDDPANEYSLADELHGIRERITLGLRGFKQIPTLISEARRSAPSYLPDDLETLPKPRGRDKTRKFMSAHRTCALSLIPLARLEEVAREHEGTPNAVLVAVTANLLRRARAARGGDASRTLQLIMPVDLTSREEIDRSWRRGAGLSAEETMTTVNIVLPGGPPTHGSLREIRARTKAALLADAATAPSLRGVPDVARLVPEVLALGTAYLAAASFDGCVSNVPVLPAGMGMLGSHVASHVQMLGFPIGNEMIATITQFGDEVGLNVCTDPVRLGTDANLRSWLAEELAMWGLADVAM